MAPMSREEQFRVLVSTSLFTTYRERIPTPIFRAEKFTTHRNIQKSANGFQSANGNHC